jgi:Skp family chaperone for outer membrane proteins
MKKHLIYLPTVTRSVFEGGGDGGEGGAGGSDNAGGQGGTGGEKMVPQTKVNSLLAEEKRAGQKALREANQLVEDLQNSANASEEERAELQKRVDQLRKSSQTEAEQHKEALDKAAQAAQQREADLTADRDKWQRLYSDSTISRSIIDASTGLVEGVKAVSPEPIVAILQPNTQLAEKLDEDGEPTGELVPEVTFQDVDKEGKPVTLSIAPSEAVKRMAKMDRYAHLFEGSGAGGTGGQGGRGRGTGSGIDGKSLQEIAQDPALYRKLRSEGKLPEA